ncbi:hypothetical protein NHX12_009482 [Muraenolepis orangiensis]|uniref:Uncharacterized protein n=1 Tax=Muraenolepis orangiensis TaxID=630683 RepID=A0A9Q0I8F0_9TELE|nr:hypothetical protein NHX12_009482 [Muraenolepis orangiensis]
MDRTEPHGETERIIIIVSPDETSWRDILDPNVYPTAEEAERNRRRSAVTPKIRSDDAVEAGRRLKSLLYTCLPLVYLRLRLQ